MKIRIYSKLWLAMLGVFLLVLSGCNFPKTGTAPQGEDQNQLATLVAATLTVPPQHPTDAMPAASTLPVVSLTAPSISTGMPTSTPTVIPTSTQAAPSPAPDTAQVSGKVCYRTAAIPAMTAYFEDTGTHKTVQQAISAGQTTYQVTLPPGTYQAYAWLTDYSLGGLYSKAVTCGLKSSCTDHEPIPFTVKAGDTVKDIDLCDWYAFSVPLPPDKPSADTKGSILGSLTYPGEAIPEMHVVAFNVNTSYYYWVYTNSKQNSYTISSLPPGTYHVVAYTHSNAGGYADVSTHALIDVTVAPGKMTTGVNIVDWSAPAGAFPPDPTTW